MKKTIGKFLALIAVLAIIACFTFALVACNEKGDGITTKDLTAEEAEVLLFDSKLGAFRNTGTASDVKIVFSETSGANKRAGEAAEYYLDYANVKGGKSKTDIILTYSNISTDTTNTTYYLAYEYNENDGMYRGPYYMLRENGTVVNAGKNNKADTATVNELRSKSGLNDANSKIETVKDAVKNDDNGVITYAATEYYDGETYLYTTVTATYSYTDANGKVEGTATIKVIKTDYVKADDVENGNVISEVSFAESNYTYSATYVYNIDEIEVPWTAEGWIAECPIA